jgi:hypothetical protein
LEIGRPALTFNSLTPKTSILVNDFRRRLYQSFPRLSRRDQ